MYARSSKGFSQLMILSSLVLLSGTSLVAHADPARSIASNVSSGTHAPPAGAGVGEGTYTGTHDMAATSLDQHYFQSNVAGRSLSNRDVIFHSLLATEGKDLAWPGFPRTWHEQTESDTVTANTAYSLPVSHVTAAVSIEFKYSLKTSMVIIAANKAEDDCVPDDKTKCVAKSPVGDPIQLEIFKWDEKTQRALPNVRKDYPMVGFCAFEASLNYAVGEKGGIDFFGASVSVDHTRTRSLSHTINSRFFQIDGTQSPMQMLENICNGEFRKQVEQYVARDFSRTVVEVVAYDDRNNECQPDANIDPAGDSACMDWNRKYSSDLMQKLTKPRCVLTRAGTHRCQLQSKEGASCGMWWDRAGQKFVSTSAAIGLGQGNVIKATSGLYEYECDASAGLKCAMRNTPPVWFNIPVWSGSANCVRK